MRQHDLEFVCSYVYVWVGVPGRSFYSFTGTATSCPAVVCTSSYRRVYVCNTLFPEILERLSSMFSDMAAHQFTTLLSTTSFLSYIKAVYMLYNIQVYIKTVVEEGIN